MISENLINKSEISYFNDYSKQLFNSPNYNSLSLSLSLSLSHTHTHTLAINLSSPYLHKPSTKLHLIRKNLNMAKMLKKCSKGCTNFYVEKSEWIILISPGYFLITPDSSNEAGKSISSPSNTFNHGTVNCSAIFPKYFMIGL